MLVIILLVLGSGFALGMAWEEIADPIHPAQAQKTDHYDCDNFHYQEAAQAIYDHNTHDPHGLDGPPGPAFDGEQGVACEELPAGLHHNEHHIDHGEGYRDGYHEGYRNGYHEGYRDGYHEGHSGR